MAKRLVSFIFIICSAIYAGAYDGRVYIDSNADGKYDSGDRCLPGICVSDGKNVVKTDENGLFSLPGYGKEKFIFITVPAGYRTFGGHYQRIDNECESYDFILYPYSLSAEKNGRHSFIQISDTEISGAEGNEEWAGNVRKYAESENAAFIIHTGDICYEAGLKSHIRLMNPVSMGIPVYYCIGNHDLVKGDYGEQLFESLYGPVWYSFDTGNVHYIVTPMSHGDYAHDYTKEDFYDWLVNDLAMQPDGKPIMIFNHDLACYDEDFIFRKNQDEAVNLDKYNLKAWIYGHWHINHVRKHTKTTSICTSTLACGGIDHATSAFRVMHVDGNGDFRSEMRYTFIDKKIEIASVGNMNALAGPDGKLFMSVNTYHSDSPTVRVKCSYIFGGKASKQVELVQNTDFNWSGNLMLPKQAYGKTVTVKAEAEYNNGETAVTEESFVYRADCSAAPETGQDSWTNLSCNSAHDGKNRTDIGDRLALKWISNTGSNIYMTSPVVNNGILFIATVDDNGGNGACVLAIDTENGKQIWKSNVEGSIKNTIALSNDKVFAQDIFGNLYAFAQNDGSLAWKKKLDVEKFLPAFNEGLAVKDNIVYAGAGAGLCALDADSGKEIWKNAEWSQREGCVVTLSVDDNVIIGGAHWRAIYANNPNTGKLLWSYERDGLRNRSSSPSLHGNLAYCISNETFFIFESADGDIVYKKPVKANLDVASTPLVTDNEVIFGSADKGVIALERETYEEKWNFVTGEALISTAPYTRKAHTVETSPQASGKMVFFAASDGNIYGLDRETGKKLWSFSSGAPFFASVCICGNALFAADFSGNVYAFTSGEEL